MYGMATIRTAAPAPFPRFTGDLPVRTPGATIPAARTAPESLRIERDTDFLERVLTGLRLLNVAPAAPRHAPHRAAQPIESEGTLS